MGAPREGEDRPMNPLILVLLLPALLVVPILALIRYCWAIITNPPKAWRIAVGYDQLANVALNGDEDETISSRAHRAAQNGRAWGCVLCKLLDKLDKNHCEKSAGV